MPTFYVKYPPEGDEHFRRPTAEEWEPCTYPIEPEFAGLDRTMSGLRAQWEQTGNPLTILEVHRVAHQFKIYPPLWAVHQLMERIDIAFGGKDSPSLDRTFGLTGKGLGKGRYTTSMEQGRLRARNRVMCLAVFKLEGAGLSRRKAYSALASLLSRIPDGQHLVVGDKSCTLTREEISAEGVRKAITGAEAEYSAERAMTLEAAKDWTELERQQLLAMFYRSEIK